MKSVCNNILFFAFSFLLLFMDCKKADKKPVSESTSLSVAAAANLRDVLMVLKQSYIKDNPGCTIEITFGSSGMLAQQLLNGAPYDLFLSADTNFPEKLKQANKTADKSRIYAYGKLAVWSKNIDVSKGLEALSDPKIRKIAIANPKIAPYGKNAVETLQKSGLYTAVENKIVWAENISQAAQFASSGNADVAFIALSNALNKEMNQKGKYYELSKESSPIAQSGVVIKGKNITLSQHFFSYLTSKKADEIWLKYGYGTIAH